VAPALVAQRAPGLLASVGPGLLVATTFLVKSTNVALVLVFGAVLIVRAARCLRTPELRCALVPVAVAAVAVPVLCFFVRNELVIGGLSG